MCRRAGCARGPVELGLCGDCLARYRTRWLRDQFVLATAAGRLIGPVCVRLPQWPIAGQHLMACNLAAQLIWGTGGNAWLAALRLTVIELVDALEAKGTVDV